MFVFKKYWEIPNGSYNLTETLWKIQKRQKRACQCYSTKERVGCRYWKHGKAHTKAGKSLSLRWPRPSIVDPQVAALGPGRLSVPVRTVTPLTTVMSPPWQSSTLAHYVASCVKNFIPGVISHLLYSVLLESSKKRFKRWSTCNLMSHH